MAGGIHRRQRGVRKDALFVILPAAAYVILPVAAAAALPPVSCPRELNPIS